MRSQDLLIDEVLLTSERYISRENKTDDLELPLMEFEALAMATNRFSDANMLGQGGLGIVYKVKNDSKMYSQFITVQGFILLIIKQVCNRECYLMGKKSQ